MKQIRKRFLALLALTLFGGAGAWAQTETLLTTIVNTGDNASFRSGSKTFDNIATVTFSDEVNNDNDNWGWYCSYERTLTVTAASDAYTITRVKFYTASGSAFDEEAPFLAIVYSESSYFAKVNGTSIGMWGVNKIEVYGYEGTAEPAAQEIELTKSGANQWTLSQTPDYDLELQVEYYGEYNIDSIPVNWQVKVGDAAPVSPTAYTEGNTTLGHLTITETESVMLIPPDSVKNLVKSVNLVGVAPAVQTITIGGITLDITGCTTWADIIARNPSVIRDWYGVVASDEGILSTGGQYDGVYPSDPYDPQQSNYHWEEY